MSQNDRYSCPRGRRIPVNDLDSFNGHSPAQMPSPAENEPALPVTTPEDRHWEEASATPPEPCAPSISSMSSTPSTLSDLSDLRARVADLEDRWKRAAADLDNYRKRFDREIARLRLAERETILRAWLTVVDDMERALCAQGASANPWYEGMEAIHARMLAVLAQFGVRPFLPQGEAFDPDRHEAVATANLPDQPEGKIVEVVQTGYLLDGRVLRPAKVIAVKR
jgi:molecular chaperone GrpE